MERFQEFQSLIPASERARRKKNKQNTLIILLIVIVGTAAIILIASLGGKSSQEVEDEPKFSLENETVHLDDDYESNLLRLPFGTSRSDKVKKSPIVRIKQGRLQGIVQQSRQGRNYFSFYSVPYGKVPARFEPPEPAPKWTSRVLDAGKVRTSCLAWNKTTASVVGSEDCLDLHIYTPKLPQNGKSPNLPVLVYIFGGAFKSGRATRYGGDYFMDEDVILVFMDYRLGSFGHLNTGDSTVTGNQSFKDQTMALRWVNDNIHKFGGNRKRIILFGNSSGAISVHAHLLSSMSAGLFHGAISESGVALGPNIPNILMTNPEIMSKALGTEIGCPNVEDSKILVDCLRNADASLLASVNKSHIAWDLTRESLPENGDLSTTFLIDTPWNLMNQGRINAVPWINGINSGEKFGDAYDLIRTPELVKELNENWTQVLIEDALTLEDPNGTLSREIRNVYFNGADYINETQRVGLRDVLSDRVWIHPSRIAGMVHSKYQPVYFYYFSKEPQVSHAEAKKAGFDPPHGVGHGDELQFIYPYEPFKYINLDDDLAEVSLQVVKTWVSFARTGIPDANGVEEWTQISNNQTDSMFGMVWFQLNDKNLRKNIEPFTDRMKFWDSLPNLYS